MKKSAKIVGKKNALNLGGECLTFRIGGDDMMICPKAGECGGRGSCGHIEQHEKEPSCNTGRCQYSEEAVFCIPYVRELHDGDRGRVLGKTSGMSLALECTLSWLIQKPNEPIEITEKLIAYAEKSECFMEFLMNGYIEEVQPEVFYKQNDRFLKYGEEHALVQVAAGRMLMICLANGNRVRWGRFDVKNTSKITAEEFTKIAGDPKGWKKI